MRMKYIGRGKKHAQKERRERIAADILKAMVAKYPAVIEKTPDDTYYESMALGATAYADALIKELDK